jgi:hypothetical protein
MSPRRKPPEPERGHEGPPHRQHVAPPLEHDPGPAPRAQWVGFFLEPAAFFAHLQIRYVLVPWACVQRAELVVQAIDLLAVLLAALGAYYGWRTWARAGRADPGEAGGAIPRTRLLGVMGLGMSLMFALVLFGQWMTTWFFSACQ